MIGSKWIFIQLIDRRLDIQIILGRTKCHPENPPSCSRRDRRRMVRTKLPKSQFRMG